jgi:hypothetical protein
VAAFGNIEEGFNCHCKRVKRTAEIGPPKDIPRANGKSRMRMG